MEHSLNLQVVSTNFKIYVLSEYALKINFKRKVICTIYLLSVSRL